MKAYRSLKPIPVMLAIIAMFAISVACLTAYRSFQAQGGDQVKIWDKNGNAVYPSRFKDTPSTMQVYDNKTKQVIEIERQADGTWKQK
ncbi:hypothetical protein [Lacticaseibacillus porcinae]|uniref:hypothetical protein n=1 Tax=Lacticaseibacillus porcinae TaxID=1123687 RepID=UPI000F7975FE|nr:hypothetical protein [Lacticaseibacillus porcinae]